MAGLSAPRLTRNLRLALWLSLALLGLRLNVAYGLGFGDAEALYACYALYPQPAYLDHPGLIGALLRLLGAGTAPSPETAHAASALLATLIPWLGAAAAWASGQSWEHSARVVLAMALVPEMSVGLFGVSPDLPLAICWLSSLAAVCYLTRATRQHPHSRRTLLAWLVLGVALGFGVLAKVSAGLLGVALVVASLRKSTRPIWRGYGPWLALLLALILTAPLVTWEVNQGYPMLRHRLVATQAHAGVSLTNLLKLIGGQLIYVTPPYLIAAWFVARDLYRRRRTDELSQTLWLCFALPLGALTALCLWSDRAEPHWLAPALLPLGIHCARYDLISKRLGVISLVTGALVALSVWAAVKTDAFIQLASSQLGQALGGYRPRYDLTNDLYAWGPGRKLLRQAVEGVIRDSGHTPMVVGAPHWMVCAQAQLAVEGHVRTGCYSLLPNDFDRWTPRTEWRRASSILLVQDSRYPIDEAREFPERRVVSSWRTQVRRGSHVVRTIRISRLDRTHGVARASESPTRRAPPRRMAGAAAP